MQSKRDELVPVAEVVSRLDGPVAAIREASPQALHHYTPIRSGKPACLGQRSGLRSRLHGATMALCSLPRTNPGDYPQAADVTFKKAQRVRSNPSEKQKILPMEGEPLNPRDR